jgi:hypothetical protein
VAKHLLDETAEFVMPRDGRHSADENVETTRKFNLGFRRQPPVPAPQDSQAR